MHVSESGLVILLLLLMAVYTALSLYIVCKQYRVVEVVIRSADHDNHAHKSRMVLPAHLHFIVYTVQ